MCIRDRPSSSIWAPNCLIIGTRAPVCPNVTGQIRVGVLLQQDILHSITYPRRHAIVRSTLDVANEAEEIHVLLFCPFGNATGRMAKSTERVISSHSRTVKDLHQDFRCNGLERARLGRWLRTIGAGRCGVQAVHNDLLIWGPNVNIDVQG
eukprot:2394224-Pyramimonas_sp.AAC.1